MDKVNIVNLMEGTNFDDYDIIISLNKYGINFINENIKKIDNVEDKKRLLS